MLSLFSSRLFIQKFNIAESFLREGKGENKRSLREGAICKPNRDEQRGRGDKLWNFWAKVLFEYPLLQSLSLYDRCFDIFTTFYKQCDDNFSIVSMQVEILFNELVSPKILKYLL